MANEASPSPPPQGSPGRGRSPAASSSSSQDPNQDRSAGRETVLLDDVGIRRALMRIAHEIVERNADLDRIYLVAVPNSGVPLGRRLTECLSQVADARPPLGILDTTLYRDDLVSRGSRPRLRRTEMPSSVDDRVVILIEDVVSTGRTIRAALDALMDFGRPRAVQVVALIDRGHRELPIKIDYVGKNIPTRREQRVELRGIEGGLDGPLEVVLVDPAPGTGDREGGAG